MAHPMRKYASREAEQKHWTRSAGLKASASVVAMAGAALPHAALAADVDSASEITYVSIPVVQDISGHPDARPSLPPSAERRDFAEGDHQIRFRADTLVVTPVLNAALVDSAHSIVAGDRIHIQTYSNYPAFIERGEVRIYAAGQSVDAAPLAVVPVDANGAAFWQVPEDVQPDLFYTYRVTGKQGRFDETAPKELTVVSRALADNMEFGPRPAHPEFGTHDEAARRAIALNGLMATVTGRADPARDHVLVAGQAVPVDPDGRFAAQQIVSREGAGLDVVILRDGREIERVSQSFAVPKNDWFVVGQGELTVGKSYASGPARLVSGEQAAQGSYATGRTAFYAKGAIGDDVKITASLDSGEMPLKDLFSNLDRKDPRQLLRRMNAEQYYPTYGDDSTLVEDAPSQGRFYLRAQKGDSQFVIGNFTTQVSGSDLASLDRGLFGALIDLKTAETTGFGERKAQVIGFASDPGTVPAREEFRGTGGSLFFLKRQDITIGSERVRIEVRDAETGLVLESRELHVQEDYDFNPVQGQLTLLKPLPSRVRTDNTVREGASAGHVPVLVVRYEYTPPVGSLDGYTLGGRASTWLGEQLRLGVTAQRDTVEAAHQTMLGADAIFRIGAGTYLKGEIAQTKGPGFGQSNSIDGGLTFTDIATPGSATVARAWRTEAAMDFAELAGKQGDLGKIAAYYEHQDAGFSAAGRLTPSETQRWGLRASVPFAKAARVDAKYDELATADIGRSKAGVVNLAGDIKAGSGTLTAKAGLRYEDRAASLLYNSQENGSRVDAGMELGFKPANSSWTLGAFAQATLDRDAARSRNNRAGLVAEAELTQRLSFRGEVSQGDGGLAADLALNHRLGYGSEAYVGYALSADRTDAPLGSQNIFTRSNGGSLVIGARQRFSDSLSVHGENRIGLGGNAPSLSRSFGINFDPTERLSVTGTFENGRIDDATTGVFRRTAASLGVGYTAPGLRIGSAIEMRNDRSSGDAIGGDTARDQTVWLLRNNLDFAFDHDWRFIGELNLARTEASTPSIPAAEFTEAVAGFAYRPVENERLNALVRLHYFEDMGPVGQITGSGQTQSPKQVSTIFSADFNYDLSKRVTLGGKYGYRQGKVSLARDSDAFVNSEAHLGVVRLDYHVNRAWDVLAEGRALWVTQAQDMRLGALGAVYRHLGDNVKIGVGYSLSDFSDDLSDQSYTSHGPFINLLGKF